MKEDIFGTENICFDIVAIDESISFLPRSRQAHHRFLYKSFCNFDVFGDGLTTLHPQSGTFTTTGAMILISKLLSI